MSFLDNSASTILNVSKGFNEFSDVYGEMVTENPLEIEKINIGTESLVDIHQPTPKVRLSRSYSARRHTQFQSDMEPYDDVIKTLSLPRELPPLRLSLKKRGKGSITLV